MMTVAQMSVTKTPVPPSNTILAQCNLAIFFKHLPEGLLHSSACFDISPVSWGQGLDILVLVSTHYTYIDKMTKNVKPTYIDAITLNSICMLISIIWSSVDFVLIYQIDHIDNNTKTKMKLQVPKFRERFPRNHCDHDMKKRRPETFLGKKRSDREVEEVCHSSYAETVNLP